MPIRFVDLFSGAGGLSHGFIDAGFECVYANEIDPIFCKTFKKNHPEVIVDNQDINKMDIHATFKDVKNIHLVVGGPPCQGFSQKGNRMGVSDERNFLFKKFVEVVKVLNPEFFLMENVPNLISSNKGFFFNEIKKEFEVLGYEIESSILNSYDYGVPQKRRRAFIVGNRVKKKFKFPKILLKKYSVNEAISDLPKLESGQGEYFMNYKDGSNSSYQKTMRRGSDGIFNHVATNHSADALEKLSLIPPLGDKSDLPSQLRTRSIYSGTWSRIDPEGPSRTITTRFDTPSSGQFTLNDQDRCLTVREAARLQSFPDKFIFCGTKTSQMKQVGNAVPPLLAKEIAKEIFKLF